MENINYTSFRDYFRALEAEYGDLGADRLFSAFSRTGWGSAWTANPYINNTRVKRISSVPVNYDRAAIARMIEEPNTHETPLRQTAAALESSAYPFFKIRKTYQDLLTYHFYSAPAWVEEEDVKKPEFMREWRLVEKINDAIRPAQAAHQIAGQTVRDGKVFYILRARIDKSHNSVPYAFLQQLPQDWVKIVGLNNLSKYTVAFNLMYFFEPGTDWRQFGELFAPYMEEFGARMERRGARKGEAARAMSTGDGRTPEIYEQNGRWFYWVTLPPERVWPFECDDVSRNVATPLTGLMLSMTDIANYESVQLELVQNPLVSILHGSIPYADNADPKMADPYKLSPTGRQFFETLWYQMLNANNTSGIGLYAAPFENMKLEQLAEAPNATNISASGYAYTIMKSGLSSIIPITEEPRAGLANISMMLESRYAQGIYDQFANMMNWLYESLNLRWKWKFHMFGSLATDQDDLEQAKEGATLGILSEVFRYNALLGRSTLDDIAMSRTIDEIGLLEMRKPLITSFSAKQENGLPPQSGRPKSDGVTSDGKEQDMDE